MDDTDLGRPIRHERKKVSRRAPRTMPVAEVDLGDERPCAGCGAAVEVPLIVGPAPEFLRDLVERQRAGVVMVECEACVEAREALEAAREREEVLIGRIAQRRARSGIPPKWAVQTFDDLDRDPRRARALERAQQWARGEVGEWEGRRGLVLWGGVGRGKTAIAAAAANMRMAVSAVRWLSVAELLMDLSMGFESEERKRALHALDATHGSAALVLDDLDKMRPTEHAVGPLFLAVNRWLEAKLPLLVTLNRDLDDLRAWLPETYGEPLSSRLSGYCKVHEVGGVDRRLA